MTNWIKHKVMEQLQKLTSAVSDIWTNQQMLLKRIKELEGKESA